MTLDFSITVSGATYPCRATMGAMFAYKRVTGHDVPAEMTPEDLIIFIWACAASGCRAMGVQFPYPDAETFADFLTMDEGAAAIDAYARAAVGDEAVDEAKKKATQSL